MDCLSDDRLLGFVRGELPDSEREAVETHLDGCQSCFRLVGTAMRMGGDAPAKQGPTTARGDDVFDAEDDAERLVAGPGAIADGRYVVRDLLGQGGAGAVYRAYDSQLGRQIALKIVRAPKLAADAAESMQARLLREARAMARVSHPNVVAVYDVGSIDDRVFVVMELVEGRTLATWQIEKPRSWREVIETFSAAGVGLAAAHRVGLVHRDFKPLNVLVGFDDRVRVTDFGLARPVAHSDSGQGTPSGDSMPEGHHDWTLTMTGGLVGTPRYMAPEQFRAGPADARSDQFSFCVALFSALYGQHPFFPKGSKKPPLPELATLVVAGIVVEPPEIEAIPPGVLNVLRRGLSVDPAERYPSMDALITDLSRQIEPTQVDRRLRFALGGLAGVALITSAIVVLRPAPQASDTRDAASSGTNHAEAVAATPSGSSVSVPISTPAPPVSSAASVLAPALAPASRSPRIRSPAKAPLGASPKPRPTAPAPNPDRLKNPF
jgi:eukaryotic-like serine/threonine-protein kinase